MCIPEWFTCFLDDLTPIVRWWHRRFGHGETSQGICWCCGNIRIGE